MLREEAGRKTFVEFERNIWRAIEKRTARQVRALNVESTTDRLIISGIVSSYHVKQLVLQGAIDAIGDKLRICIDLRVDVITSSSRIDCD